MHKSKSHCNPRTQDTAPGADAPVLCSLEQTPCLTVDPSRFHILPRKQVLPNTEARSTSRDPRDKLSLTLSKSPFPNMMNVSPVNTLRPQHFHLQPVSFRGVFTQRMTGAVGRYFSS